MIRKIDIRIPPGLEEKHEDPWFGHPPMDDPLEAGFVKIQFFDGATEAVKLPAEPSEELGTPLTTIQVAEDQRRFFRVGGFYRITWIEEVDGEEKEKTGFIVASEVTYLGNRGDSGYTYITLDGGIDDDEMEKEIPETIAFVEYWRDIPDWAKPDDEIIPEEFDYTIDKNGYSQPVKTYSGYRLIPSDTNDPNQGKQAEIDKEDGTICGNSPFLSTYVTGRIQDNKHQFKVITNKFTFQDRNKEKIKEEFEDKDEDERWDRKPILKPRDSDDAGRRAYVGNGYYNLRVELKTGSNSRLDISPDMNDEGEKRGPCRISKGTGGQPIEYFFNSGPGIFHLKVSEKGTRSVCHHISTDYSGDPKYYMDWTPEGIFFSPFDTSNSDRYKVTTTPYYEDPDGQDHSVTSPFIIAGREVKVFLIARTWLYYIRRSFDLGLKDWNWISYVLGFGLQKIPSCGGNISGISLPAEIEFESGEYAITYGDLTTSGETGTCTRYTKGVCEYRWGPDFDLYNTDGVDFMYLPGAPLGQEWEHVSHTITEREALGRKTNYVSSVTYRYKEGTHTCEHWMGLFYDRAPSDLQLKEPSEEESQNFYYTDSHWRGDWDEGGTIPTYEAEPTAIIEERCDSRRTQIKEDLEIALQEAGGYSEEVIRNKIEDIKGGMNDFHFFAFGKTAFHYGPRPDPDDYPTYPNLPWIVNQAPDLKPIYSSISSNYTGLDYLDDVITKPIWDKVYNSEIFEDYQEGMPEDAERVMWDDSPYGAAICPNKEGSLLAIIKVSNSVFYVWQKQDEEEDSGEGTGELQGDAYKLFGIPIENEDYKGEEEIGFENYNWEHALSQYCSLTRSESYDPEDTDYTIYDFIDQCRGTGRKIEKFLFTPIIEEEPDEQLFAYSEKRWFKMGRIIKPNDNIGEIELESPGFILCASEYPVGGCCWAGDWRPDYLYNVGDQIYINSSGRKRVFDCVKEHISNMTNVIQEEYWTELDVDPPETLDPPYFQWLKGSGWSGRFRRERYVNGSYGFECRISDSEYPQD